MTIGDGSGLTRIRSSLIPISISRRLLVFSQHLKKRYPAPPEQRKPVDEVEPPGERPRAAIKHSGWKSVIRYTRRLRSRMLSGAIQCNNKGGLPVNRISSQDRSSDQSPNTMRVLVLTVQRMRVLKIGFFVWFAAKLDDPQMAFTAGRVSDPHRRATKDHQARHICLRPRVRARKSGYTGPPHQSPVEANRKCKLYRFLSALNSTASFSHGVAQISCEVTVS